MRSGFGLKFCSDASICRLQKLYLFNNKIGDAGVTALAEACAKGSLAQLTVRLLSNAGIWAAETRCAVSFGAEVLLCRVILPFTDAVAQQEPNR